MYTARTSWLALWDHSRLAGDDLVFSPGARASRQQQVFVPTNFCQSWAATALCNGVVAQPVKGNSNAIA
jgi:hypothetical protein